MAALLETASLGAVHEALWKFFSVSSRRAIFVPPSDSDAHAFHFNQTPYSLISVPCPAHAREGRSGSAYGAISTHCVAITFSVLRQERRALFGRLRSMDAIRSTAGMGWRRANSTTEAAELATRPKDSGGGPSYLVHSGSATGPRLNELSDTAGEHGLIT
jgi:hypothetical protein